MKPEHAPSEWGLVRPSRRRFLETSGIALGLGMVLAGCGFRLRGAYEFPFQGLWVAPGLPPALVRHLRSQLQALGSARLLEDPEKADAHLHPLHYQRDKEVLTLTGTGKVREFRLHTRLAVQVLRPDARILYPPFERTQQRSLSWEDATWLAHEHEEDTLFEHMDEALAVALIRHLGQFAPSVPSAQQED